MAMKKSYANMSSSKAAKRRIRSCIVKTSRWSCFEGCRFWVLIPRSLLRGAFITPLFTQRAVRLHDVLGERQQHAHGMLRHGLSVGARLVDDENASSRARHHIHRVTAGS